MNMHAKAEAFQPEETANLPMERASIEQIESYRHAALARYAEAFDLLQDAADLASKAAISGDLPGAGYMDDKTAGLLRHAKGDARVLRRDEFIGKVRHRLDAAIWSHLLEMTDLERLMDKQAREEFRTQLNENPPEATAENAYATLKNLVESADDIFRRGIANVFSKLDRRFRSHDGFKIGSRVVLEGCFSDYGGWNVYRHHDETLRDIERTFHILDGKPQPERYAGIVGQVDQARQGGGYGPSAFSVESEYFEIRTFKNGNAHLWFKRKDLIERVNKLLAEHYGAVLGEGADSAAPKASQAVEPRRGFAKNFGFFPTPSEVARKLMQHGNCETVSPDIRILEPSAGTGSLIKLVVEAGANPDNITAVEVQENHGVELRLAGAGRVLVRDFLSCQPEELGEFDLVIMNPPFDMGRDCDHVMHAMKFVKAGGKLLAIMSAGVEFREDKRTKAFRNAVEQWKAIDWHEAFRDLPAGSFAETGTNVNTITLAIKRPEA